MGKRKSRPHPPGGADETAFLAVHKVNAWKDIACKAMEVIARFAWPVCLFLTVRSLAGKDTDANIVLAVVTDFMKQDRTAEAALLLLAVAGWWYGWSCRALHRQSVAEIGRWRETYEKLHDPNRSSSGLPPSGETRPEDQT
jgi:hypothetical protein